MIKEKDLVKGKLYIFYSQNTKTISFIKYNSKEIINKRILNEFLDLEYNNVKCYPSLKDIFDLIKFSHETFIHIFELDIWKDLKIFEVKE